MSRHEEMHFGMHFHSSMSIKTILAAHHHTMNTYSVLVCSNDEEKAFNSKTNKIGKQKNGNETTTWSSNDARRRSDFNKMTSIISFPICRSIDCVLKIHLNSVATKNKYTHIPVRIERGKIDNKNDMFNTKRLFTHCIHFARVHSIENHKHIWHIRLSVLC